MTLFPSGRILRTLASQHPPDTIGTLFCAALDSVQNKQYNSATLTTLLPTLLQNGLTLPSSAPKAGPPHAFMNTEPCDGGMTVHCPAGVTDGEVLLHSFVTTLTTVASDLLTTCEGEHFTVSQDGGERFRFALPRFRFALPKCIAAHHSFTISNSSLKNFKLFFEVAENSGDSCAKPTGQDGLEDCPHQPLDDFYEQVMEAAAP